MASVGPNNLRLFVGPDDGDVGASSRGDDHLADESTAGADVLRLYGPRETDPVIDQQMAEIELWGQEQMLDLILSLIVAVTPTDENPNILRCRHYITEACDILRELRERSESEGVLRPRQCLGEPRNTDRSSTSSWTRIEFTRIEQVLRCVREASIELGLASHAGSQRDFASYVSHMCDQVAESVKRCMHILMRCASTHAGAAPALAVVQADDDDDGSAVIPFRPTLPTQ